MTGEARVGGVRAGRSRVAVLYPRGLKTGGPEAVHQLVDELRRQGVSAFVCPDPNTTTESRVDEFAHYDAPELAWERLQGDDLLIGPEIYTWELIHAPVARRLMWWLSVDHAAGFKHTLAVRDRYRRRATLAEGRLRTVKRLAYEAGLRRRLRRAKAISHRAQSSYAQGFAGRLTGNVVPLLSDYTTLVAAHSEVSRSSRRVAFNPLKGGDLVHEVSRGCPELDFVPLTGLAPEQLATTLRGSGMYLDLGHHPGKDRLPREAALAGCAVVVAQRGAGALDADVPIGDRYKIPQGPHLVETCRQVLREIALSLPDALGDQSDFRTAVQSERSTFASECADLIASMRL